MVEDILVATGATIWLLFFCALCLGALWSFSWFGLRIVGAWHFARNAQLHLPDGWDNAFCRAMSRTWIFCHGVVHGIGDAEQ